MDGILYPGMPLIERLGLGGGSNLPAAPAEDNGPDLTSILAQIKQAEAEKTKQDKLEEDLLKRMGVTVQDRQKNLIAEDTPKGFWGKLGKFGLEALAGAAQGRNYQPYSDRMMDRAMKQHQLETPGLREQLDSVVSQKNNLTTNMQRLEKDRQSALANAAKQAQAAKLLGFNREKFNAGAPYRDAQTQKVLAQTGLIGSQTAKTDTQTEGEAIKNVNNSNNKGLTGKSALELMAAGDPTLAGNLLKNKEGELAAKQKFAPVKTTAAKPEKWKQASGLVDDNNRPMLINERGEVRPMDAATAGAFAKLTGENAGAVSRSVSGYRQMQDLDKTIENIAKKGKFGLVEGAFNKYFAGKGMVDDPDVAKLVSMVDSISKFGVGIHGMRAEQAARHLFSKLMLLQTSPETMKAGLEPMRRAFAERGTIPGAEPFWKSQEIDIEDVRKFLRGEDKKAAPAGEKKVWKGAEAQKRLLEILK